MISRTAITPNKVSIASISLIVAIVTLVGLVGSRYVVDYQAQQSILNALNHNRHLAEGYSELLRSPEELGVSMSKAAVLEHFADMIKKIGNGSGYRTYLFAARSGRVLAHSDPAILFDSFHIEDLIKGKASIDDTVLTDLSSQDHAFMGRSVDERISLVFHKYVEFPLLEEPMVIGVERDVEFIFEEFERIHQQVKLFLVFMGLAIAVLGFITLRPIGRLYERKLERQVSQRSDELRSAQERLMQQERMAVIGKTAAVLSHEIRNPLASIKLGLSSLLTTESLSARGRKRVELATHEVDRLDELLTRTLAYVRPVDVDCEQVDIAALLDRAIAMFELVLKNNRIELRRQQTPDRCTTCADPGPMYQALTNLIKNASEACPAGGEIHIDLSCRADTIRIEISNDTNPLPDSVFEHMFDPFVTSKPSGAGLGLPLAKKIIEDHMGTLVFRKISETRIQALLSLPVRAPKPGSAARPA